MARDAATRTPDLDSPDNYLPAVVARNESRVRRGFWRKLGRVAARIPFAEEAAAAYYCAIDRETPHRVRGTLLAALAYFVLPADVIPDFIAGIGFTDDATVLLAAINVVQGHLKPRHRERAQQALDQLKTDRPA